MITIQLIVITLTLHYIGDFILQSRVMALNKSKDALALSAHVTVYTLVLSPIGFFLTPINAVTFLVANFILHYLVDYCTSRVVRYLFATERYYTRLPNIGAFSIIGFDQLLHLLSLFLTLAILL